VKGRVVGEDGTPIPGARLHEIRFGSDVISSATEEHRGVLAVGETDAEGRFDLAITDSWSNGLTVRISARGWCLPDASYLAGTVTLTNAKENVVTLVRGVPLTVSVLDDATGQPIAGADVAVYTSRGYVLYTSRAMTEGVTGTHGTAEIRVPGGNLRVVAGATGYAQREGEGVNVGLEGARVTVRLARGGTLEGLVVDPEGRPVAGARVGLLRAPAVHLRSVTDAEGRFRFEHVPAYVAAGPDVPALRLTLVVVDAEGFMRTFSAGDSPPEGGSATRRVTMLLPKVLLGRARYADGSPALDVHLLAGTTVGEPSWGWTVVLNAASTRTGPDGSFRFEGVVPGSVALRLVSRQSEEPLMRVQVPAEGVPSAVDLVLERELAPVHVQVRDAAGRPVRAAAVGLTPTEGRGGVRSGGQEHTNTEGRASLTPSAPGPWWLYVDAPGAGPLVRRVETAEAQAGPIEVDPGDGVVEGRAERLDGRPARVRLALLWVFQEGDSSTMGAGWQGAVETDEEGRFRFAGVHEGVNGLRSVTSGMSVIPSMIPGFSARSRDLRVVVLDDAEAARLRIDVEVLDDVELKPLPLGTSVMVQREGQTSSWPLHAVREVPGRFRSPEPLEPGTWIVRVAATGYVSEEVEIVQPRTGGLQPLRMLLRKKQ
jgi:protocatechuate 3,4-dioxygenase beta subunit